MVFFGFKLCQNCGFFVFDDKLEILFLEILF